MTRTAEKLRTRQQNKTEKALRLLIESNLALQWLLPAISYRMTYSERNYVKEFCTVKMSSSRRAGHTSSILTLGQEMFVNPLFVGANSVIVKRLREFLVTNFYKDKKVAKEMVVMPGKLRGLAFPIGTGCKKRVEYDAIFVDNYSMLTEEEENSVVDFAQICLKGRFCLVFVG